MTGDRHPCGHDATTRGCGGCDPGAIDYVIDENRVLRPFDPDRDMQRPMTTDPKPQLPPSYWIAQRADLKSRRETEARDPKETEK